MEDVTTFDRVVCGKSAYPPILSVIADIAAQPGSADFVAKVRD
jgi:hypothetical protein